MNDTGTVLAGRHAVVTGGGTGIGAAIAEKLVAQGAVVTIMGRNEERLANAAGEIGAQPVAVDVTDGESVRAGFAAATSAQGPVSVLVNNAGAVEACLLAKLNEEDWLATIDVNLNGVFRCTKAVLPSMLAAGRGHIVNIASTAARRGYAYVTAYCAAKHGVIGLTRALALECAQSGVTVNAVCPGYTDTEIVDRAVARIVDATGRTPEEARADLVKSNPQGRFIQPQEVAGVVLWLLGDDAASITGQAIAVAGGEVM